ncbi:hypothetical protein ACLF6K_07205 [Streptomyces xanthophaeus]|uniref:hypothetical protein n=1 Tax=Streptomyces xanthophaeus TaxID=67385 RepID=UPI003990258B
MRQEGSAQRLCGFIATAAALAVLICYSGRVEAGPDDARPGDAPWSRTAGNREAGLGESREEILTLVRKSSSRARALAQQATAHAEDAHRMTVHSERSQKARKASAQAALAARAAARALEAAAQADQAATAALTTIDLGLMRELERTALRAETRADAAARAAEAAHQAA